MSESRQPHRGPGSSGAEQELIRLILQLAAGTGNVTQLEQAEALEISDTSLSAYVRGERIVPERTLLKMLEAAGVPSREQGRYLRVRRQAEDARQTAPSPPTPAQAASSNRPGAPRPRGPAPMAEASEQEPPDDRACPQPLPGVAQSNGQPHQSPASVQTPAHQFDPPEPAERPPVPRSATGSATTPSPGEPLQVKAKVTHDRMTRVLLMLGVVALVIVAIGAVGVGTNRITLGSDEKRPSSPDHKSPSSSPSPTPTRPSTKARTNRAEPPPTSRPAKKAPTTTASAPSSPPPAPPPANAAPPPAPLTTGCQWIVIRDGARVFEEPAHYRELRLKAKDKGDEVGPYCTTQPNATEGKTYVAVRTDAAADKIGWMNREALTPAPSS